MRKKNLSVKVAALAMSGTLAMAPMTVRADEIAGTPAAPAATAPAASTTTAAPASTTTPAASGAATTPAAGTTATTPAAPVTVTEPAADPATTAPNNVDTVVPDDTMQGTKMDAGFLLNAEIKPEDTKNDKKFGDSSFLASLSPLSDTKNKDLVLNGDLSISKDGNAYNSTEIAPFDANSGESYTLKADLDVSAVTKAIKGAEEAQLNGGNAYVDKLETGLRSTFTMDNNLSGSFHLPTDLEDAKQHYELSSADGNPMIYRINYGKSSFSEKKVSIAMDLDLTKMTPLVNQYTWDKVGLE